MPLYADDHRRSQHPPAIREDITAALSATVALASAGASIRMASSSLAPERAARSPTAVRICIHVINKKYVYRNSNKRSVDISKK